MSILPESFENLVSGVETIVSEVMSARGQEMHQASDIGSQILRKHYVIEVAKPDLVNDSSQTAIAMAGRIAADVQPAAPNVETVITPNEPLATVTDLAAIRARVEAAGNLQPGEMNQVDVTPVTVQPISWQQPSTPENQAQAEEARRAVAQIHGDQELAA